MIDVIGGSGRTINHIAAESVILALADRIRRLSPSPRNSDHFHEEKSDIVHALRRIAREVAR